MASSNEPNTGWTWNDVHKAVDKALSTAASFKTVIAGGATVLAASPFIKRAGIGRSISLGVSSWFRGPPERARAMYVQRTKALLRSFPDAGRYGVIVGPKGVGKTTAILAATAHTPGVVNIEVRAGKSADDILHAVDTAITRNEWTLFRPARSAARVAWWHNVIFRQPPTIVLQVKELDPGDKHAQVTSATRTLADSGLRVLVDASPNSVGERLFTTTRQEVLEVPLMSASEIRDDSELGPLLERLQQLGLADVVWAVIGGHPGILHKLALVVNDDEKIAATAIKEVNDAVGTAVDNRKQLEAASTDYPAPAAVIDAFASSHSSVIAVTHELDKLPTPRVNKVYRREIRGEKDVFVAATPAMGLVLVHGRNWPPRPTLDELKLLCQNAWPSSVSEPKS